ncbi:PAS domain-containing sensor histidine kinase [Pyruvatibacter sp.]|uniref:sensor histidine kinase NtrY-like n=1 Tax=Pyruvatibacter sp. TaxID=1981328 RepID=UPI0032EB693D
MASADQMTHLKGSYRTAFARVAWLLRRIQWPTFLGIGLAIMAVVSGIATYLTLTGATDFVPSRVMVISLLLFNMAIVLTLFALIAYRLVRLWIARRAGSAGARLHVRLVGMFSFVAVMPAIIVAVFAATTLDRSLDSWFSERTRTIIDNASTVAEAYFNEHRQVLRADALAMAADLNRYAPLFFSNPARFREVMTTQVALRSLSGGFVADANGQLMAYAEGSTSTRLTPPSPEVLQSLGEGEAHLTASEDGDQVQALVRLTSFGNAFLLVSRQVDGRVLDHLARTRAAAAEYANLESRRYTVQLTFALIYVIVALLVLLAAIWLGLWAANRLVSPIGDLVGAAERVSDGDLSTRVEIGSDADEISTLGRTFNRMTGQLQSQRNELMEANHQLDRRRRFTETVLSGVSAGVIGLDTKGRINLVNKSCLSLLERTRDELIGQSLVATVPEMATCVRQAMARRDRPAESQITLTRDDGSQRTMTVRVTSEKSGDDAHGYVVTLDDISELVSAQRASAWADIAQRIAHEIKNPLTPIQLSAERLKRKYGAQITDDPEVFEQCTNTIVRQVEDLGRMVDEFSSFARMPTAVMVPEDISALVREAVFLQRVAAPDISFEVEGAQQPVMVECDRRQLSQALTNLIKNAIEAIATRREQVPADDHTLPDRIVISVDDTTENGGEMVSIDIADTGIGLPRGERYRLVEPYVTRREKGTGLGLAIVKKIMEDHAGSLLLEDAPWVATGGHGACIKMLMPRRQVSDTDPTPDIDTENTNDTDTAAQPFAARASVGLTS